MLQDLILQAKNILDQTHPEDQALVEVENALSAYLEAVATERISETIPPADLDHANRLLREIRRKRSRRLAESQQSQSLEQPSSQRMESATNPEDRLNVSPQFDDDDTYDPLRKFMSSSHNPEAEKMMDSAEEAFYAGNYQKAIPLFEQVLQIEPGWTRPQEHRDEAEEFLRTGNIPSVALPPEAGRAYGKAQSAARVFRYKTALGYLDEAFAYLKESGISRWREGEELRQDLENQMQAHQVYQEGLASLQQGDLQAGLSKVQTAASSVATPEYVDKASEIREDIASLDEIADLVNLSGNVPADLLAESRIKLDRLTIKYGEIPQISRLRNRMDIILPNVISGLIEKIQRLKRQAESASSLKTAKAAYTEADELLTTFQALQPDHTQAHSFHSDVQNGHQEIDQLEESLELASQALKTENRFFPRNAYTISKTVRSRFPQDPEVLNLKQRLRWYYVTLYGGGAITGLLIIMIVWFGGRGIASLVRNRQLAMTPSPTATFTITPIPSITPTATVTPSFTPSPTETPFYTPTPTPIVKATVVRDLFAYSGCYETTNQVGKIYEGGEVTIIALPQRVFDDLNRECVLVEYLGEERTVTGYILIADLIIP